MPKIAQYEPDQVSSQVVAQPLARSAPAGAFDGITQGLGALAAAGVAMKKRVDTTSAEEALVKFERDKNQVFFNPESGYFNSQGRNAYDGSTATSKSLEDLKEKYGADLNSESKALFDRAAGAHITRGQQDIARHASKGLKAWEIATIEAQVENSVENATLYWNDPERLGVQKVLGRQSIMKASEMAGIGAEATAEKLQTFESSFASSIVVAATQSSAAEGQAALDDQDTLLEGPDLLSAKAAIEKKTKAEKTQADAGYAILTATKLTRQYNDRGSIRDEVNKIEDPILRKKTMAEAMSQFSRNEQIEKERAVDSYHDAISEVNKGKTPAEIQAQNAEAWDGMTDIQRNNILSGKHMITDQAMLNDLLSLPSKELAAVKPADHADSLRPKDVSKLRTAVDKAKKGEPGSRVSALSSKVMMIAQGTFGHKSKWAKKSGKFSESGEKANQFLTDMQDAIDDAEDIKGAKLTPGEEDDLISEVTEPILVERSRFGLDILASDDELSLSDTPLPDLRLLHQILDNAPNVDKATLVDAYQYLIDNEQTVNQTTLFNVYKQGQR